MKKQFQTIKIFLPVFLVITVFFSHAQQEFTLTTSASNIISAKALIDLPGLTGNPDAIIMATQLPNSTTSNTNPVGAWYYSGKWNIFNSNFAAMSAGLSYKVQYFPAPGPNAFLHLVTLQNLGTEGSYIDNAALNNNPNAQFTIFQNHSPDIRTGSWLNPYHSIKAYSAAAGKWYITNAAGQQLLKGCAYNIVISASAVTPLPPIPIDNGSTQFCKCPASLPPNGNAGGDLSGTYPNPSVQKLLGRPISNTAPATGQVLKWNGTEWTPSNESSGSGNTGTYTAGLGLNLTGTMFSANAADPLWNASKLLGRDMLTTQPAVGQVLKWGGGSWYPADDALGTGGTNNPENWKINGANISNSNTGNVGIGNNNPAFQLDLSNRMRIRSGGNNSVSAGIWLNKNSNTEAAFIGMEDDTNVGFYGNEGAGWKFTMNTKTGALKINGFEGVAGQVLTSNGAASPPSWKPSTGGAGIKSYYKYTTNKLYSWEISIDDDKEKKIPSISGLIIEVSVPTRLIISASCYVEVGCPAIGSCPLSFDFYYKVNNNSSYPFSFAGAEYMTGVISNHFYDVAPGTYTLDFYSRKGGIWNQLSYKTAGGYVTVIALPK